MTNIYSEKTSGNILLTPSNLRNKPNRYLQTQKAFSFSRPKAPKKVRGKVFFHKRKDRKYSITVTNNNSNVIPTTNRKGVSNRDMVGKFAPQQIFFSMYLNPGKPIQWKSRKVHQLMKRLMLSKSIPLAGRSKTFCRSLHENSTGSQGFGHSKRIQNPISFKTLTVKYPLPTNWESWKGRISESGGKRNVERRSHQKSSKEEFVSNVFLVKKKHGCQRPVINLPLFHNVSSEWEVCKICNTCCKKEITRAS